MCKCRIEGVQGPLQVNQSCLDIREVNMLTNQYAAVLILLKVVFCSKSFTFSQMHQHKTSNLNLKTT